MPVAFRSKTDELCRRRPVRRAGVVRAALAVLIAVGALPAHAAPTLPEIRLSAHNAMPVCVTPERLMAFLKRRNDHLNPRFRDIAAYYKKHGEAWGVRWDYAFFQMAIETNFLTYRAPSGRMGDVDPKQNNFAGIGTTGGGVPGDSFPDVSTGVLGQIQHLVVYSGEMIPNPVAPRTQLKQEHILAKSRELNRQVRFSDLAGRWAADRQYGGSIEWVAERFRMESCKGRAAPQAQETLPWKQPAADGARAAAPAAKAIAVADVRPTVGTAWSRDQKASPAKKAQPAEAKAATAVAKAPKADVKPPAKDQGPAPDAKSEVPAAGVAETTSTGAAPEAETPGFALFSPPAALADVKVPGPKPEKIVPEKPAAASKAEPAKLRQKLSETVAGPPPPAADAVMQPLTSAAAQEPQMETPKAVSGKTVAGFMLGGTGKLDYLPPSGLGVKPGRCVIESARYGGETTVLVKAPEGDDTHYVALSVLDGFEDSMTKTFLASRAQGGEVLGVFPSRDEALAKARGFCPD